MRAGGKVLGEIARRRRQGSVLALVCLALGCDRGGSDPAPGSSANSDAAAKPATRPFCVASTPGAHFVIGKKGPAADGGEQALDLPFAVELGGAAALPSGAWAVGGLRSLGGGTSALLTVVSRNSASGKVVELGRVHGDVDAPRVATSSAGLFVAVPDNDSSQSTLRLAQIKQPDTAPSVAWGPTIQQGSDESQVFALAVGPQRGVLAWDEWDKGAGHSVVRVATFDTANLGSVTRPRTISPEGTDAEAPRLVSRPPTQGGGFWISWFAHARLDPKKLAKPQGKSPDAGADGGDDLESLVEVGQRWLEISRLDDLGSALGAPIPVSRKNGGVLVSDLASTGDGSALLAWRDNGDAPGVERARVELARVDVAGAVLRSVIQDEAVAGGVPELIVPLADSPSGEGVPYAWLALSDVTDETRIGPLAKADLQLAEELRPDPLIGTSQVVAGRGFELLLARPDGLAMELTAARCRPGKDVAPSPDGGPAPPPSAAP